MIRRRRRRLARVEVDVELWHVGLGQCVASRRFTGLAPLEIATELTVLASPAPADESTQASVARQLERGLTEDESWISYVDPAELRLRVKVRQP